MKCIHIKSLQTLTSFWRISRIEQERLNTIIYSGTPTSCPFWFSIFLNKTNGWKPLHLPERQQQVSQWHTEEQQASSRGCRISGVQLWIKAIISISTHGGGRTVGRALTGSPANSGGWFGFSFSICVLLKTDRQTASRKCEMHTLPGGHLRDAGSGDRWLGPLLPLPC